MPEAILTQLTLPFDTENWRDVPGYEGLYQVSDLGNVRSYRRTKGPPKPLKGTPYRSGYVSVTLRKDGAKQRKRVKVYHLVLAAFIGPCPNGKEANHKFGDKTDNRLHSLEYATPSENCLHRSRVLGKERGSNHGMAKLNEAQVKVIRRMCKHRIIPQREIANLFGVSHTLIKQLSSGKGWIHVT